ncbi:MAG: rRNA pseudouridine synthase [Clostridiales bacterium]|nr:rRNA pseudouridine synthase [Clostridiales bacterium]
MRLQKYIAKCGVASRRKAESLIADGRVSLNGQTITEMGILVDPDNDIVKVNDKLISIEKRKIVLLVNKPEGYVSTSNDQFNRKTVLDIIPDFKERLYPIGRLDYDSCGLLLLTNDGDLTYKLTHPKHHISKIYSVEIDHEFIESDKIKFERGFELEGYITKPSKVIVRSNKIIEITLYEGRNRQIRKMLELLGYSVIKLERIQIGNIKDSNLKSGQYRYLNEQEILELRRNFDD